MHAHGAATRVYVDYVQHKQQQQAVRALHSNRKTDKFECMMTSIHQVRLATAPVYAACTLLCSVAVNVENIVGAAVRAVLVPVGVPATMCSQRASETNVDMLRNDCQRQPQLATTNTTVNTAVNDTSRHVRGVTPPTQICIDRAWLSKFGSVDRKPRHSVEDPTGLHALLAAGGGVDCTVIVLPA